MLREKLGGPHFIECWPASTAAWNSLRLDNYRIELSLCLVFTQKRFALHTIADVSIYIGYTTIAAGKALDEDFISWQKEDSHK